MQSRFHILRSIYTLDPSNKKGFWGPATSTLDWCESNYVVSLYIAEFWNTVSNFNYILLSFLGLWSCYKIKAEPRDYITLFGACGLIGMGSFLFHMTLLYPLQLSDEIPMIFGSCLCLFCLLNTFPPNKYMIVSGIGLMMYAIGVTVIYEITRIPELFQICYGISAVLCAILPIRIIYKLQSIHPIETKKIIRLYVQNLISFGFGFMLWNIENLNCDALRNWRKNVSPSIGWISQLHAWWHMFTGLGGYGNAILCLYSRQLALSRLDIELVYFGPYPYVIKKDKKE